MEAVTPILVRHGTSDSFLTLSKVSLLLIKPTRAFRASVAHIRDLLTQASRSNVSAFVFTWAIDHKFHISVDFLIISKNYFELSFMRL
jgi:hypothetical protein